MIWSTDTVSFAIIAALVSSLGGVIIYIHTRLTKKVDSLDEKFDEVAKQNMLDHALVCEGMARIEQAVKGIDRDVERHEKRLDGLERDVDHITRREL